MCDRRGRGTSEKGASPGRREQSHGSSRAEGLAREEADRPSAFAALTREELLSDLTAFAKNWLAHDGCWFLAAEERDGMDAAIELDARAWERFAGTVDPRIVTRCLRCPPEPNAGGACTWEFRLEEQGGRRAARVTRGNRSVP